MEIELKITNDGIKRLRNRKTLTYQPNYPSKDLTIKLRYADRHEIERTIREINDKVEKEMHLK